jgi:tripartite-type tricarboxylate transporter receptor subunit TctC
MNRRQFAALLGGTAAAGVAPMRRTGAQTYPSRTITLVAPIAPGGGVDTVARIVAEKLQEKLPQPVVVENRTGAGGLIGAASVAKAAPDGYTFLVMEPSEVLAKWLRKNVAFDVLTDFTPIALVTTTPLVLFAHPTLPVNDTSELIAYSKASPGKLSAGTPGIGTPHHIAALMLNAAAGIDIAQVPYRGSAPALSDLLAGQIPLLWATPVAVLPFVQQGKVKAIAIATLAREPILPQVPTIAENAVPGFHVDIWLGIAAPAHVPAETVALLDRAIGEITNIPEVGTRMSSLGFNLDYRPAEKFRALIASDHQRYGEVIRAAGIEPN